MGSLKDILEILRRLGVEPAKIKVSKQIESDICEQAKEIACGRLLKGKPSPSDPR